MSGGRVLRHVARPDTLRRADDRARFETFQSVGLTGERSRGDDEDPRERMLRLANEGRIIREFLESPAWKLIQWYLTNKAASLWNRIGDPSVTDEEALNLRRELIGVTYMERFMETLLNESEQAEQQLGSPTGR